MKVTQRFRVSLDWVLTLSILVISPLLVKLSRIHLTASEQFIYERPQFNDLFAYARGIVILVLVSLLLLWFLFGLLTQERKIHTPTFVYPILGYTVLTIISSIFSLEPTVSYRGLVDKYEGLWILLSYGSLYLVATQLNDVSRYATLILRTLGASLSIVVIAGITQPLNFNLMNTNLIKGLIIGFNNIDKIDDIFKNPLMIYSTLGNPNIVGSFIALLLPIIFYWFISAEKKARIAPALLWASGVCLMVGSRSLAGLAGFIIGHAVLVRFLDRRLAFQSLILTLASLSLACIYDQFSPTVLLDTEYLGILISGITLWALLYFIKRIPAKQIRVLLISLLLLSIPVAILYFNASQTQEHSATLYFNDIQTNGNELIINYDLNQMNTILQVRTENNVLKFYDSGQLLNITNNAKSSSISGQQYADFDFVYLHKNDYDFVMFKKLDFGFFIKNNKFYMMNSGKHSVNIQHPAKLPIDHYEKLGSGRAYIWSRSVPLIQDTLLYGVGPDNYVFKFPQNDLVGKLNIGNPLLIVDKPHNWYIQVAINSGLLALVCIVYLYYKTCVLYITKAKDITQLILENHLFVGLFSGITGYHVAAFFNDSSVSVAPTFWILYGILIASMHVKPAK